MPRSPARSDAALAGWYVILCRAAGHNAACARRLRSFGARTMALPMFRVVDAPDARAAQHALRAALACDGVLFTSPAAVRAAERLTPEWPTRARCAIAVGQGTARALTRANWRGDVLWPTQPGSEAVLELVALQPTLRLGLVTAPEGRGLIETDLAARGVEVVRADVYRREPLNPRPAHWSRLARATGNLAALFSSVQALRRLHAQLPDSLRARLRSATCVVSSSRLRDEAQRLGWQQVLLAAGPDPVQMVNALHDFASAASSCSIDVSTPTSLP